VRLLPVQVTAAPVVSVSGPIELLLASGERVSFAVGTDTEYVARLVAALGLKAC
jgi:hypothetical protein